MTRLVRVYARRFSVQERLGQQIADHLNEVMDPHGVAVHLQAAHLCTQMRGRAGGALADHDLGLAGQLRA